jgi:hypothetical protein
VKTFLLTTALLGMTLFVGPAFSQEEEKAPPKKEGQANAWTLDGNWSIVYAELNGKRLDEKDVTDLTIRNQVLSYKQDGKQKTWRFSVLPGHRFTAIEMRGEGKNERGPETRPLRPGAPINAESVRQGVFVASAEYLALGMDRLQAIREGVPGVPVAPGAPGLPVAPGAPGLQPVPGAAPQPGLPGTAPVIPGAQGQAARQNILGSEFVLILKRNTSNKSESGR